VTPFVEKTYHLAETAQALRYFNEGHARGKLVITIDDEESSASQMTADQYVLATDLCLAETMRGVGQMREVNR
jgi:hypothetical protein